MLEILIASVFFSSVTGLNRFSRDITHPYFWTNLSFLFYGISLVYLYIEGISGARFLLLAGLNIDFYTYLLYAACIIMIAKVSLELMVRKNRVDLHRPLKMFKVRANQLFLLRLISLALSAIGFTYWIYVTAIITGGSFKIFSNIGVFKHVIKDSGLSTIYFQFLYVGAQLWFLTFFLRGPQKSILKYMLFAPAFVVMLTTGRLSQSFLLLITPIFFAISAGDGTVPLKRVRSVLGIGFLLILGLYFYRQYTSFLYIGKPDDFFALVTNGKGQSYVAKAIIGSGNFPDPQQLMLLVHGLINGKMNLTFGTTYFDWLLNIITSGETQSVGYRILNTYFPEKVGGPTPGATGEALLNFGPFFPFALILFGYFMVKYQRYAKKSSSVLVKFIYLKTLLHFWALFVKVDSSLLLGLIWQIVPISAIWVLLLKKRTAKIRDKKVMI